MKHIYVIQMHTGSLPGRVIRLLTRYEYSHVVMALDTDCKTTYSFGRKHMYHIWKGGFVEEKQSGAFFSRFDRTKCRIYEIEVTEKQYEYVKEILMQKKDHENDYKYDFVGIVLRFFHIPVSFENKAVCSQFVAEVLEEGGVVYFTKPAFFLRPRDFDSCPECKTIYEGLYLDYQMCRPA